MLKKKRKKHRVSEILLRKMDVNNLNNIKCMTSTVNLFFINNYIMTYTHDLCLCL